MISLSFPDCISLCDVYPVIFCSFSGVIYRICCIYLFNKFYMFSNLPPELWILNHVNYIYFNFTVFPNRVSTHPNLFPFILQCVHHTNFLSIGVSLTFIFILQHVITAPLQHSGVCVYVWPKSPQYSQYIFFSISPTCLCHPPVTHLFVCILWPVTCNL